MSNASPGDVSLANLDKRLDLLTQEVANVSGQIKSVSAVIERLVIIEERSSVIRQAQQKVEQDIACLEDRFTKGEMRQARIWGGIAVIVIGWGFVSDLIVNKIFS